MEQIPLEQSQNLEDNLPMVNYIMLHRIYDLLTIVARHLDQESTDKMIAFHDAGYLLGPTPSYTSDEENPEK